MEYWINKKREKVDQRFSTSFIINALKNILERNVFYFDGKMYRQKCGIAMGTKVAPTYATLVMGYFIEDILFQRISHKYSHDVAVYIRINWKRFLDDCFILWKSNFSPDQFCQELNSLHPQIKFIMNQSETEIEFLDVLKKILN